MLTSQGNTTAPPAGAAPTAPQDGENAQARPDKDTRTKELRQLSKAELQKVAGVKAEDDRTKEELVRSIVAQEFARKPEPAAGAAAARAPAFDPAGTMPVAQETLPEGHKQVSVEELPSLMDPRSSKAGLDTQHRGEVLRTRDALHAQPKVSIHLPQRAAGKPQLPNETVQINDYTYQIPRGVFVEVPAEVARILHESGRMSVD